jgi:hypothetical protein
MAWNTPRQWIGGEMGDAAKMNAAIRDEMLFMLPSGAAKVNIAYNAALFTAATGLWTVQNVDLGSHFYMVVMNEVWVTAQIVQSSLSASTASITYTIPIGSIAVGGCVRQVGYCIDNGGETSAIIQPVSGTTLLITRTDGVNFSISPNNFWLYFSFPYVTA